MATMVLYRILGFFFIFGFMMTPFLASGQVLNVDDPRVIDFVQKGIKRYCEISFHSVIPIVDRIVKAAIDHKIVREDGLDVSEPVFMIGLDIKLESNATSTHRCLMKGGMLPATRKKVELFCGAGRKASALMKIPTNDFYIRESVRRSMKKYNKTLQGFGASAKLERVESAVVKIWKGVYYETKVLLLIPERSEIARCTIQATWVQTGGRENEISCNHFQNSSPSNGKMKESSVDHPVIKIP